jgi:hypothetical protein
MNCQTCRIEIEEMETSERLSEQAAEHIASCPPCRAFHDERQSLRKLVGSLEPVSAPPDFEFRLRARLAAAGNGKQQPFSWRSFISSAPALGLAATFVLLVAGIIFYNQIKSGTTTGKQAAEVAQQEPGTKATAPSVESTTANNTSKTEVVPNVIQKSEPVIQTAVNQPSRTTVSNRNIGRQPRRFVTGGSQIVTNEMASKGALQIRPAGDSPLAETAGQVVLPVRSSAQPVRVMVNDSSGVKRTVSLQPVIFGSQDLTGHNDPRVPGPQGIW